MLTYISEGYVIHIIVDDNEDDALNMYIIIGIAAGGTVIIVLLVLITIVTIVNVRRRNRRRGKYVPCLGDQCLRD